MSIASMLPERPVRCCFLSIAAVKGLALIPRVLYEDTTKRSSLSTRSLFVGVLLMIGQCELDRPHGVVPRAKTTVDATRVLYGSSASLARDDTRVAATIVSALEEIHLKTNLIVASDGEFGKVAPV
ncbi:hypothetical protein KIN20_004800 [Parelaphostrongylus tenuis]|uniref:Uncharacterized protein n=1 Tax=Parelaphostrongylus tenuis TaxID=148309 RepID=A0AAD5LZD6_PARTN|nr:hypothetical protein KIN20_004800 [Parelaphostrongylus tenuis]